MNKIKVLIVEDDAPTRTQLSRVVAKEGFDVQSAEDGRAGLALFEKTPADVIITDLRMPGMDGLELVHSVKRLAPETEFIVSTAFGETSTAIALLREGVLDYLKKPIEIEELLLALGRAREKIERRRNVPFFPRLLLADDEDSMRERLARVLEREGWQVIQAGDGKRALELFTENKIDVVLLDVKMPKMHGLEALHAMRQITDDFAAIVLTGYSDESMAVQAMREGALNLLRKPIDLDQLIVAVDKAIQSIQVERALKYRMRDLQLAQQIIARFTAQRQVIIDLGNSRNEEVRAFAREMLDLLPLGLVVLDRSLAVRHANEQIVRWVGYAPTVLEQKWLDALANAGIRGLKVEDLMARIHPMLTGEPCAVHKIATGAHSYVAVASLSLREGDSTEYAVVLAARGERP